MNLVIGAGISGLSAAQALGDDFLVLEKSGGPGGLAGQYRAGGFAFDYGGHYFHFQGKPEIKEHVQGFRPFREYRRNSKVFLLGRFIPYSLQYHLAFLPAVLRREVLGEILAGSNVEGDDLEAFLRARFGQRLFRLFFAPFLRKFYGRPLAGMIAGMDKGSIPVPRLEEVLAGARERRRSAEGYNPVFYYPIGSLQGFIEDYCRPLRERIRFHERVVRIEPRRQRLFTTAGEYRYDNLISTMPLKELLRILSPALPYSGRELQHISTLVVNAVLARHRRRFHWLYLPEESFPFYRVGYYPAAGRVAVYLERTIGPAAKVEGSSLRRETVFTLRRTGMIERESELLFMDARRIPISYVVFDRHWPRLVPAILSQLRRRRIHSIGRYGGWNYTSMADDISLARETASQIRRR